MTNKQLDQNIENHFTVNCLSEFANSMLNGTRVIVLQDRPDLGLVNTLICSGKNSGKSWQFCRSHIIGLYGVTHG